MSDKRPWSFREIIIALVAFCFVLFINGAIPFLMLPTLGQVVWSMGFAQSYATGSLIDLHVHDFGIPNPAAVAFGLAGVWPASLLIRLGLHTADAYSGMVALWLGLAMYSAYQIARYFNVARMVSLLAAVAWMTMPIIWAHAGYSMLSLGIALLSFYFLAALRLFMVGRQANRLSFIIVATYFASAIIAIFMDGYTFMMFACGSSFLLLHSFITRPEIRNIFMKVVIPVHTASFAVAYILYRAFIGKSGFTAESIDMFRGWGLDLSFIATPTTGILWLPDFLGLSQTRSGEIYYGDASVWVTTFSLPIILLGSWAWWKSKQRFKIVTGVFCIALLSYYMALGPSLKINSIKPEYLNLQVMPAELAIAPTFNAWISENIPGFNTMRASYRWSALGIFAFWLLFTISLARKDNSRRFAVVGLIFLILLNMPNFQIKWKKSVADRNMLQQIDQQLVTAFKQHIHPGEIVSFIPWGNDFFANYLAPKAGFRTYNIGGDKNLQAAIVAWPPTMRQTGAPLDATKAKNALKMLVDGSADVLVIPYFDMLIRTPPLLNIDGTKVQQHDKLREISNIPPLSKRKSEFQTIIDTLKEFSYIEVSESPYFTSIRLRPQLAGPANRLALLSAITGNIKYPIYFGTNLKNNASGALLQNGWYHLEAQHVWSQSVAKLLLPIPENCRINTCYAVVNFSVFGASTERPVKVIFNTMNRDVPWSHTIIIESGGQQTVQVPISENEGVKILSISVPNATSPQLMNAGPDPRVLGISLQKIELSE